MQNVTPDGTVLPVAAVGVGVNLGDLLAAPKQSARAEQAVIIAEAELKRTTLEVANQVTAAYQEYQAAKLVAGFSDEAVEAAETDAKIAERNFARGGSQANNLVGARLAVHRVKADGVQSTGNVAKSWANLITLIGDPALSITGTQPQQNADRR
jgi:outer membrane protein TolC